MRAFAISPARALRGKVTPKQEPPTCERPRVQNMIEQTEKPKNPFRISAGKALAEAGMSLNDCDDSIVPACCKEGCEVEPDGECEHGCPSVLLALGVI